MRVDGASKRNAAAVADIGDLMNQLDKGDVIRARIIEITSDEAVLRLFDGTTLKAKLAEALDAKAGQTITLSVASKAEGTLVLETVRDFNARFDIKADLLKNLLESLQMKPDNKNTQAASELLKAGLPVTREAIGKILRLMDVSKDMTADKAVFIYSKAADISRLDPKLAVRFLNGDLKLGELIGELQNSMENITDSSGSDAASLNNKPASNISKEQASQPVASSDTVFEPAGMSSKVQGKQSGDPVLSSGDADGAVPDIGTTGPNTKASNPIEGSDGANTVRNTSLSSQVIKDDPEAILPAKSAPGSFKAVLKNNADDVPDIEISPATGREIRPPKHDDAAKVQADKGESSASDQLTKARNSIKSIFVKADPDPHKLASELDAGKLYKQLESSLEMVKNAIRSPQMQGDGADMLSGAANLLGDTLKLFDQLNTGGLMYYQIPVKMADNNSTAELYIMKKQRNGKRIDPGNTVMFFSLDTVNMGRIETLIDVKNRNISIQMRTEGPKISDYIKDYTKDLYNGLSELGYKLTGIRFKTIDAASDPMMQEKLLEELRQGNIGRIDFRV